jgi:hypothetical protein
MASPDPGTMPTHALVTFCNTGSTPERHCALVCLSTGEAEAVPLGGTGATGIARLPDGEFVVALPEQGSLVRVSQDLIPIDRIEDGRLVDAHSLVAGDGAVLAVSTGRDCVLSFGVGERQLGSPAVHPATDTDADTLHVNSVCMHEGRMLVSMFGLGWRDQPDDARTGSIVELGSRRTVSAGIRHPHSVTSYGGQLYLCSSPAGTVDEVLADGRRVVRARYPGYLRGLHLDAGGALVGVSRMRRRSRGSGAPIRSEAIGADRSGILRFGPGWEPMGFIDLTWFGSEIFDVTALDGDP